MNAADLVFLCLPDAAARRPWSLATTPRPGSSTPPPPTGRRRAGSMAFRAAARPPGAIRPPESGWPTPAATPRASSPLSPPWWQAGLLPRMRGPVLPLPHRLLWRREEDDRPVRGGQKAPGAGQPRPYGHTQKPTSTCRRCRSSAGLLTRRSLTPSWMTLPGMATTVPLHRRADGQPTLPGPPPGAGGPLRRAEAGPRGPSEESRRRQEAVAGGTGEMACPCGGGNDEHSPSPPCSTTWARAPPALPCRTWT